MKNSKKIVAAGISLLLLVIVFIIYFITISNRIKIISPAGGDVLQMGENVLVKWEGGPNDASEVFVYLVPNTRKQCKAFTTNGSMATCRFWPIYSGENRGQFTWLVGSQPYPFHELETGRYRLWITTDHSDYSKESFSDFITLIENQTLVSEDTSEWKTYTNKELGIEFKYPTKSFVQLYGDRNTIMVEDVSKTKYGFTIDIVDQDKYRAPSVSHSEYIYDYSRPTNMFTATDITGSPIFPGKCPEVFSLNNIPFYISYQSGYYNAGGNDNSSYILLTNKGKLLVINFNDQGTRTNPILSTFKLIGDTQAKQANCVNDIQTQDRVYKNIVYEYSLHVPQKYVVYECNMDRNGSVYSQPKEATEMSDFVFILKNAEDIHLIRTCSELKSNKYMHLSVSAHPIIKDEYSGYVDNWTNTNVSKDYFIAKEIEFLGRKALLQEKMTVVGKDNFGSYKQLLIPGEKYFYYIDYKEKSDVFDKIFESFKLIDQE